MSDSRRNFLTGAAVIGAAAAGYAVGVGGKGEQKATLSAPAVNKNEGVSLKMQASWAVAFS